MSVLDKINIGINTKRSSHQMNFSNDTTANIGVIQPTMCREMVPDQTLHVQVESLCRMLALQNPTFGNLSLRHYHTFVPYNRLWRPFDAMLANKTFPAADGTAISYTGTPEFGSDWIELLIKMFSDVSVYNFYDIKTAIAPGAVIGGSTVPSDPDEFCTWFNSYVTRTGAPNALNAFFNLSLSASSAANHQKMFNVFSYVTNFRALGYHNLGVFNLGSLYGAYQTVSDVSDTVPNLTYNEADETVGTLRHYQYTNSPVSLENADLVIEDRENSGFVFMFKFKPILKKIRQIFIGLGYQFNPFTPDSVGFSPFKLMAYHAACFELFHPIREKNFQDTYNYKLTQQTGQTYFHVGDLNHNMFRDFILQDLIKTTYFLPMDYFSASTRTIENTDQAFVLSSPTSGNASDPYISDVYQSSNGAIPTGSDSDNPLYQRMALRLYRFSNKNTVIGRSIQNYLRVHFGISDVSEDNSSVVSKIGASRTDINMLPIMSTADTQTSDGGSALGAFAGQGSGYSKSEKFDFTADTFGVWLTLTVIVPESSLYQGYLRENRHVIRNDFFNKQFDALGYQVIERGEVSADYTAKGSGTGFNPSTLGYTTGFGFIPRYSEYKVAQNIQNGDLSIRGLRNSMASFTLNRQLPTESFHYGYAESEKQIYIASPDYVPTTVYDYFRAIDQTDVIGNYNRIFSYTGSDFDHFIMHFNFKVKSVAPWKPLSSSFDTFDDDDNTSIALHKA